MRTIRTKPALVFDAKEVCRVCELDRLFLANWVTNGVVTPHIWGKRCKDLGHRFSVGQTVALAIIAALRASPRRCGNEYAKLLLEHFAGLDDAAIDFWLEDRKDAASEEGLASGMANPTADAIFGNHGAPRLPGDEAIHKDILRRVDRVRDAVRALRGLPPGPAGLDPAPGRLTGAAKGTKDKRT
jgi:hypothetical protein